MATSPKSPRGSYEEVNDVTRKLGENGPSGMWPLLQYIPQMFQIRQLKTVFFDNSFRDYIF